MRVKDKIRRDQVAADLPDQDDLQAARLLLMLRGSRNCTRCGGLLVKEQLDSAPDTLLEQVSALRCVQCGDVLDRVILRNRIDPTAAGRARLEDTLWAEEPKAASPILQEVEIA